MRFGKYVEDNCPDVRVIYTRKTDVFVTLAGRANATLPFWLGHKECLICNGTLEQVGNVSIKLTDEMVKGLKKGGWTENILVDLLKRNGTAKFPCGGDARS